MAYAALLTTDLDADVTRMREQGVEFLSEPYGVPEDHPLATDGAHGESDRFRDPQARGVAGRQEGAMERPRHPVEKLDHLLRAERDKRT